MNTSTVRHSTILAAACLAAMLGSVVADAAPSPKAIDVLMNRAPLQGVTLPAHARAGSAVSGTLNPAALSVPTIAFALADGRNIAASLRRVARDDRGGTQSWVGSVDGVEGSVVVITRSRGVITGFANIGTETIEIVPTTGGRHLIYAVDASRLPPAGEPRRPQRGSRDASSTMGDYGTGGFTVTSADRIVQDLLVVYTPASAARYGTAALESNIRSAVEAANQAYLNSQATVTLNIVGMSQAAFTEASSLDATLSRMETDAATSSLRDSLGADVVIVVAENGEYCGVANVMTSNSTSFAPYAKGAVFSSCLSNQSLAHEIGHIQGLEHDRDNAAGYSGAFPYAYGYRVCASDGTGFRDIMSYPCSGAPRVLLFSNPNVTYSGHAAGVSYESSPSTSAENWRGLNNTAATVAAFRGSSSVATAPVAPSSLTVQSAAYNAVTLAWADNSANESGFKLERATDGVNYSEIATLGADTRSFTDGTVAALTTYYYRVRAYNSAGASAYSGTATVRTPEVPPPPPPAPSTIAAGNNGDGTATVAWAAASGATGFELRRETWNSRKGVWGAPVTAASVPGNVLSIVDATGAGTYRYSVRALNSGGASGYAGPAQVSVTSAKKTPPGKSR